MRLYRLIQLGTKLADERCKIGVLVILVIRLFFRHRKKRMEHSYILERKPTKTKKNVSAAPESFWTRTKRRIASKVKREARNSATGSSEYKKRNHSEMNKLLNFYFRLFVKYLMSC